MAELDNLVESFVAFRERVVDAVREKHPHILAVLETVLTGKQNKVGMQITEAGQVAGEYTLQLNGIRITGTEQGILDSEVHHPFMGIIRPYVVVERAGLEKIIADEASFSADLFATLPKYLPELTIKFLPK
jgi:hypothetical protein